MKTNNTPVAEPQKKLLSEYRKELIQSAAVIFSMIECLDRNSA